MRRLWRYICILIGAPLLPRASAVARVLLSVRCCARRRTVLAVAFASDQDVWLCDGLLFELRALVCGLWRAGLAVRIAGATSVQSARPREVYHFAMLVYSYLGTI